MKKTLSKLARNEKGFGLVIVLCLLAIGGLIVTPLLNQMYTGLYSSQIYRERLIMNYAAEAGLEDGIWKTDNDEISLTPYDYQTEYSYFLPEDINGSSVNVDIKQIWPLLGLESDTYGTTPAEPDLTITGGVTNYEGKFEVRISYYTPEEQLLIDRVALWLPPSFEYVDGSSDGIATFNPTESEWHGGKALKWDFDPPINFEDLPDPGAGDPLEGGMQPGTQYPAERSLTFYVTPTGQVANGSYSWVRTTDSSLYLSWDTSVTIYQINSTASDNVTGRSTTVNSYTYVSKGVNPDWIDTGPTLFTGDYRATGSTLMKDLDDDHRRETLLSESSATISDIPQDGEVVFAYLYWAGWRTTEEADTTCTFKIGDAGEILRPNAAGNYTECDPFGDTANYLCVDEVVSDGDSTYIETRNDVTEMDTYNLEDLSTGNATIESVTVYVSSRETEADTGAAETIIRTYDTNYFGTYTDLTTSYTELSTTYTTNPYTGSAWTSAEIDALQAGVRQDDFGGGYTWSTQVYVEIGYTFAEGMSVTLRPDAAGDSTNITYQEPSSGAHWEKVKEATADGFSTYVYTSGTPQEDWYDIAWQYRKKITIDHTEVEADYNQVEKVYDTFTEASDTDLASHTPDTGTGWTKVYADAGHYLEVVASGDYITGDDAINDVGVAYTAQPDPTSVDQDISITLDSVVTDTGSKGCGIFGRRADDDNMYFAQIMPNTHEDEELCLYKRVGGVTTNLGRVALTWAIGDVIKLEIRDSAKKVYVNDVEKISSSDNALTSAGTWGVWFGKYGGGDSHHLRLDWHLDDFSAEQLEPVEADLTDFPVLISITDSDLRDHAKSDGSDIVFTAANGTTKLKREIESYDNSDGTLVAWVKTDLSSTADTEIYMYYGNSGASEIDDTDTWDANFKGVWHLGDTGGTTPIVQEDLETNQGTGSTLNVPNVTVQNDNRVLYVFVTMCNDSYQTTSSVKWKSGGSEQDFGSAIASIANSDDARVEVFRLIAPTTGTDTVYCTFSASVGTGVAAAVVSLSGVDQTTPNGTVATDQADSAEPALTVTSGGSTEVVYAACANEYGTLTSDDGGAEIWNLSPDRHMSSGNKKTGASPNVSFGWATGNSGSHWAVAGFSVKQAPVAADEIKDSTSNNNDGVITAPSAPVGADGKINGAQDFDGSDDMITIPDSSSLDVGSTFTAEAWVKWESGAQPAVEARILDKKINEGDNNGWTIKVDDYDNDEIEVRGSSGTEAAFENIVASWSAGDWYHIVMVFDGNTVYSYSDGVPFSSGTITSVVDNDNDLLIGEYGGGGNNWNGKIDEVRLSNTDRGAGWIETSYNNQSDPSSFYNVGIEEITGGAFERDLYNIPDYSHEADVNNVTVYFRFSGDYSSPDDYAGYARAAIKTNGSVYLGNTESQTGKTFVTKSYTWTTNPNTGSPWTWDEIAALQVGVELAGTASTYAYCTQVYAEVTYAYATEYNITADKNWLVENSSGYTYSCFKDVTDLLLPVAPDGNAKYTVGDVDGSLDTELSWAGWSLIIIYYSPSEDGRLFYLWEHLLYASTDDSGTFTIEGFTAPADAEATLTCFVGEGDYWYDGDSLQFNGNYLSDAVNPVDDVWNSTSSGLGGQLIEGVDIDTFDVSSPIISPGATSANLTYATGPDHWNLIYHILSFRSDHAFLTPKSTGILSFGFGGF